MLPITWRGLASRITYHALTVLAAPWAGLTVRAAEPKPPEAESLDDFVNNFSTDLAPLVALIGEKPTTQFMSQSLGWSDSVVLATGPIGILTIVMGAIRVAGFRWLKVLFGRGRENLATVEMEFMSSTSQEVCELYNGTSIVRCMGAAPVMEYMFLFPNGVGPDGLRNAQWVFMTLDEAVKKGLLDVKDHPDEWSFPVVMKNVKKLIKRFRRWLAQKILRKSNDEDRSCIPAETASAEQIPLSDIAHNALAQEHPIDHAQEHQIAPFEGVASGSAESDNSQSSDGTDPVITVIHDTSPEAPNMSLNIYSSHIRYFARILACTGVIATVALIVFWSLTVHHLSIKKDFLKEGEPVDENALILTVIGTLMVSIGTFACARIVDIRTVETYYRASDGGDIGLFWLQKQQTVNDQKFDAYATFPLKKNKVVVKSRRASAQDTAKLHLQAGTLFGAIFALTGWGLQVFGSRFLHGWVPLSQLIFALCMTMARAALRHGMAKDFGRVKLLPGFELDWLAWRLVKLARNWPDEANAAMPEDLSEKHVLPGSLSFISTSPGTGSSSSSTSGNSWLLLHIRRELARVSAYRGKLSARAENLAAAIETSMAILFRDDSGKPTESLSWTLDISSGKDGEEELSKVSLLVEPDDRGDTGWRAPAGDLDAFLSLWLYTIRAKDEKMSGRDPQLKGDESPGHWIRRKLAPKSLRLLIPKTDTPQRDRLLQNLVWWAPQSFRTLLQAKEVSNEVAGRASNEEAQTSGSRQSYHRNRIYDAGADFSTGMSADISRESRRAFHLSPITPQINGRINSDADHGQAESSTAIRIYRGNGVLSTDDEFKDVVTRAGRSFMMCSGSHAAVDINSTTRKFLHSSDHRKVLKESAWTWSEFTNRTTLGQRGTVLAMESRDETGSALAKTLLLSFLCWVTRKLEAPIQGVIELRKAEDSDTDRVLWNHNIAELIDCFQKFGFGSAQEASIYAILPLSMFAKMPLPQCLFDRARQNLLGSSPNPDHRNQAIAICKDLFHQTQQHMDAGDASIWVSGLVFFVLLLDIVQDQLNSIVVKQTSIPVGFDPSLIDNIPQLINSADMPQDFLEELNLLYSKQGRPLHEELKTIATVGVRYLSSAFRLTELHRAAMQSIAWQPPAGSADDATAGLDMGDVNKQDVFGWTPCHYAIMNDQKALLSVFLKANADLNLADMRGYTPMHYACATRDADFLRSLLDHKGRLDIQGVDGVTPLHLSVARGLDVGLHDFKYQVYSRPALRMQDCFGRLPVHEAVAGGHTNLLHCFRSTINEQDARDWTPLHLAVALNQPGAVDTLHEMSADLENIDNRGRTPLLHACHVLNWNMVQQLVKIGAKVTAKGWTGNTALHLLLLNGGTKVRGEVVGALIRGGLPVDIPNNAGFTPIHYGGLDLANAENVKFLLDWGAKHSLTSDGGLTWVHYAVRGINEMEGEMDACFSEVDLEGEPDQADGDGDGEDDDGEDDDDDDDDEEDDDDDEDDEDGDGEDDDGEDDDDGNQKDDDDSRVKFFTILRDSPHGRKVKELIRVRDQGGASPLDMARREGHPMMVKVLEEY